MRFSLFLFKFYSDPISSALLGDYCYYQFRGEDSGIGFSLFGKFMSKIMKGSHKDSEKYIWDQMRSPSAASQNRPFPKLMLWLILFVSVTYAIYTLKLLKSSHSCDYDFTGMAIHSNVNISSVVLNTFHNNNASLLPRMEEKTGLQHIVFSIAASSKLWGKRKNYIKLWWKEDKMRGIVWLDNPVETIESAGQRRKIGCCWCWYSVVPW